MVEFCAERGLCVSNTNFGHNSLNKYTRGQGRMEVKCMIGHISMKSYMQDVRLVRGIGRDLSDHHVVPCKVRLVVD